MQSPQGGKTTDHSPESLFDRFFWHWYDSDHKERRGTHTLFPDMARIGGFTVGEKGYISERCESSAAAIMQSIQESLDQAEQDFERVIGIRRGSNIESLREIDRYFTKATSSSIVKRSDSYSDGNEYAILCCEIGSYLGDRLIKEDPKLTWWINWPCWDSQIVHQETGAVASVYHWAIKLLSDENSSLYPKAIWYLQESSVKP